MKDPLEPKMSLTFVVSVNIGKHSSTLQLSRFEPQGLVQVLATPANHLYIVAWRCPRCPASIKYRRLNMFKRAGCY